MSYIGNKPANKAVVASDLDPAVITGQTALAVAPADTDEFLISDAGVLKRLDASLIGGGSLNLVKTTAITSGVSEVAFNSTYTNSTYNNYMLIGRGLSTSADNKDIGIKMSVDNGSNFATHVGFRLVHQINGGSPSYGASGNLSYIPIGSDEEADNDDNSNFKMTFYDLNSDNARKFVVGEATVVNQNGDIYFYHIGGCIVSTSAVNYIKVYNNSGGNLDDGSISLYGIGE